MVAIIDSGYSIHRILNYNENKVNQGVAQCIGAANYPVDPDKMSFDMKLNRFQKQFELNDKVKRNSVHISLNFHPSDKDLSEQKLREIADEYMEKIGFGMQPYLVYQHHDAGHPHIHIVTTNIQPNGDRIELRHIAINKSEAARKVIEKQFNLVKAADHKANAKEYYKHKPVDVETVRYGKLQTKAAIQNVLEHVLKPYKYTSLSELNAVLKLYNVAAERGSADSRMFKHNGLQYRILDAEGKPVGVPIKASLFYSRPTLKTVEKKFKENEVKRMPYKARIKNAIDLALKPNMSLSDLQNTLLKEGIHMTLRSSEAGQIYGITYIDHKTKCVFNGSALGKQYSAKAIQQRCRKEVQKTSVQGPSMSERTWKYVPDQIVPVQPAGQKSFLLQLIEDLTSPEYTSTQLPFELRGKKRRKKRKRNISNNS